MMISDDLLCLYSARVTEQDDTFTVGVPKREIGRGTVQSGEAYRVALISPVCNESSAADTRRGETGDRNSQSHNGDAQAPVSEGELRDVEIESLGEKGDGITKINGGYVVIVPDTDVGDRVTIRLDDVRENVGFAEVVKRQPDPIKSGSNGNCLWRTVALSDQQCEAAVTEH